VDRYRQGWIVRLLPENTGISVVKKLWLWRLVSGAINEHLKPIRRPGNQAWPIKRKERATPMLAKRIIVAAFAVALLVGAPFAFTESNSLFVDTPPGYLTTVASN
jgi:hypothetical protein